MYTIAALYILAAMHEPSAADVARFALPFEPSRIAESESSVRLAWQASRHHHGVAVRAAASIRGHGVDCSGMIADARWRERVWYYADDLADALRPAEVRHRAAAELRCLLGPVDYYRGRLPAPVAE